MTHGRFAKTGASLRTLSGYILIWIAIGGAAGFAVTAPFTADASCAPFNSIFGSIETHCPNGAINLFWLLVVGLPRFAIIPPALAIAMFKAALVGGMAGFALEGAVWLIASIPAALIVWAGSGYWRRRWPVVALLGLVVVAEAFALGFSE